MELSAVVLENEMASAKVPLLVRLLSKLVVEVLPAALASLIGACLFAHYQFDRPAAPAAAVTTATAAAPASAEMVQLVREEHALIRDFILAQEAAEKSRAAAADAADARAAADAQLAAAAARRGAALAAAKPAAPRGQPVVTAAADEPAMAPAAVLPTVVVAGVAQNASVPPSPALASGPAAPAQPSLVDSTLAVPGHVVAATLHAVMAIGGIPSWIGRRFGASDLDATAPASAAAS